MKPKEKEIDVFEIDVRELLFVLFRKIWLIILSTIMMAAISFLFTKFMITPQYESASQMLVLTKESSLTSLANFQLGSYLTNDYKELVLGAPVLKEVVEKLDLDFDYKELKKKISIANPEETRILIMTVRDIDPERACAIANELAEVASDYIGETMETTPPKIIGEGEVNPEPASPSVLKNTVLGGVVGAALCGMIIVLITLFDDTIKSEEDIEKYLKTVNLASVPDRKDYINGKRSAGRRRKSGRSGKKSE